MSDTGVVITAAGASCRMAAGIKKEYIFLQDQPVLAWALQPFLRERRFAPVVVTVPPGQSDRVHALLKAFVDVAVIRFVEGGKTRQESVCQALESMLSAAPEYVLIHDGARPWVSTAVIDRVVQGTREHGACVPVVETADAIKKVNSGGRVNKHLSRASTLAAQTPQGFCYPRILEAHRYAIDSGLVDYLDDSEICELKGAPAIVVPGCPRNRKITYQHDLRSM